MFHRACGVHQAASFQSEEIKLFPFHDPVIRQSWPTNWDWENILYCLLRRGRGKNSKKALVWCWSNIWQKDNEHEINPDWQTLGNYFLAKHEIFFSRQLFIHCAAMFEVTVFPVTKFESDWSTQFILDSDWSTQFILISNWATVVTWLGDVTIERHSNDSRVLRYTALLIGQTVF